MKKKKEDNQQCYFTKHNIPHVDYRDVHLLEQFVNPHGKVLSRRRSGLCAKYQRKVKRAIKQARYMALMPYVKQ
ncbi:MAG: 30S ribosomal protein S18 [Candidatus Kaiserbacteria bacterium]|nr:30S ribosomal protein S18 [Candidatus Kaiserbacteria bacterium]